MAAARTPKLLYGDKAKGEYEDLCQRFCNALDGVAQNLAAHDDAELISPRHVTDAHTALAKTGIQRGRWDEAPETEQSFGAFLVGLSFSGPGICSTIMPKAAADVVALVAFYGFLLVGATFFFHGMYRKKMPTTVASWSTFGVKIFAGAVLLLAVVYGAVSVYQRYTVGGCCGGTGTPSVQPAPQAPRAPSFIEPFDGPDPFSAPAPPAPKAPVPLVP